MSPLPRYMFLAVSLSACAGPGRLRVLISPAEIQRSLDENFPLHQELGIAELVLSDPELLLAPGADRIGLRSQLQVKIAVLVVVGTVAASGRLRFQPEESTFYLDEPTVTELRLPGLPAENTPEVMAAVNVALAAVLPRVSVHRLEDGTTKMFLRQMRVEDGVVVMELGL